MENFPKSELFLTQAASEGNKNFTIFPVHNKKAIVKLYIALETS